MAITHEQIYIQEDFTNVDLNRYLKSLVQRILESHDRTPDELNLDIEVDQIVDFDLDTAVPIGLIVNELVHNALKHGIDPVPPPHSLEIFLKPEDGQYLLSVSDSGPGFPESFSLEDSDTLGLVIVKTQVEMLNGNMKIQEDDQGVTVFVRFPPNLETSGNENETGT